MKNIWILEDEPGAQFVYREILEMRYHLTVFPDIGGMEKALEHSHLPRPELLIADLRLPGESFMSFLALPDRRQRLTFPFIVVSSVDDLDVLRMCFSHGAIDYLTKPFGKGELIVKVERFFDDLEKKSLDDDMTIHIDPTALRVRRKNVWSQLLTSKEFQIITTLNRAHNGTLSKEAMVAHIWNDVRVSGKTFDVHLFNLRKKLAPLGVEILFQPPNSYMLSCDGMRPEIKGEPISEITIEPAEYEGKS